jgi:hypothetical protein
VEAWRIIEEAEQRYLDLQELKKRNKADPSANPAVSENNPVD